MIGRLLLLTSITLACVLMVSTSCTEKEEQSDCNMSGTIKAFGTDEIASGGTYVVYVDIDCDPYNGNHVKSFEGTYIDGELHYSVSISDVAPGYYYVYMMMDVGRGMFNAGFYGADPMPWNEPVAPNVNLKCRTVLDWEIFY